MEVEYVERQRRDCPMSGNYPKFSKWLEMEEEPSPKHKNDL